MTDDIAATPATTKLEYTYRITAHTIHGETVSVEVLGETEAKATYQRARFNPEFLQRGLRMDFISHDTENAGQ